MVTEQAELNRSRFYCHFKSMDDLVDRVTEDEVLGNGSVLQNMLSLVAGSSTANGFEAFIKHDMERSALLIKQGGMDSFSIKVKRLMFGAWKAIRSLPPPRALRARSRAHRHPRKPARHGYIDIV